MTEIQEIESDDRKLNLDIILPTISIGKIEKFNVNMAKYISAQDIDNEDKAKLKKMMKNKFAGNKLQVNYILGKSAKQNKFGREFMGRLTPQGNFGLQTLSGDIRKALAKDYYWDLDIVNCHCEILNQLALKHGWKNDYLTELCTDRDAIFQRIMETSDIDRNACKVIFLSILFGGACKPTYDNWIIECFYPEVNRIMNNLAFMHPDIVKYAKTKQPSNPIGCACSLILQNEERKCLLALDEFLCINKRSMDTLIHDGGLIEKLHNETEFPADLISRAQVFLKEQTGFDLKLVVKPMTTTFALPTSIKEGKSYIEVKTEFEQDAFLCIYESKFYYIKNGKVNAFTKNELQTSFNYIKYDKIGDKGIESVSFIPQWLQDSKIRRYDNVGMFIPPFEAPENCFNLWDGLAVQKFETIITDEVLGEVQFFKDHLKFLCNNDEPSYQYVWKWFSFLFQYPAEKNNVAVIFKSEKEGMGKNLCFEIIQTLLGQEFASVICKPDTELFGGFNHLLENKLLLMLDEFAGRHGFKYSDELKALITGTEINIVKKGRDARICPNYTKFIFCTNNDFPVKITHEDRRFFVCDCNQDKPLKEYFDRLGKLKSRKDVLRALYDDLLKTDLTKVDWVRDRPLTEFYDDMRIASLPMEVVFLLNYFQDKKEATIEVTSKILYSEFLNYYVASGLNTATAQRQPQFGCRLKNLNITGFTSRKSNGYMVYTFNVSTVMQFLTQKYGVF